MCYVAQCPRYISAYFNYWNQPFVETQTNPASVEQRLNQVISMKHNWYKSNRLYKRDIIIIRINYHLNVGFWCSEVSDAHLFLCHHSQKTLDWAEWTRKKQSCRRQLRIHNLVSRWRYWPCWSQFIVFV